MSEPTRDLTSLVPAVIEQTLFEHGWTCTYHEPDSNCPDCAAAHRETAAEILAAFQRFGITVVTREAAHRTGEDR